MNCLGLPMMNPVNPAPLRSRLCFAALIILVAVGFGFEFAAGVVDGFVT